ncbi:hypothetical protein [Planktothrix mougeotii]|uniref:Transmembrane protein n=1 Tax=Planktothrix mougeotii LEGE 06226 TaxID=1828728 RepID=A0ABR9UEI4_9CYAN|nr:hypothetical protein [Planktothrix mougeotii]MBE9144879.1 hypothetical protein [Planktothrix mougeotii LEGE 06226]
MARILNFVGYFVGSICTVSLCGLISRSNPVLTPWYWVFFIVFLLTLIGLGSFYGRRAYVGLLNTSEAVMFGILIIMFVGCILGGVAAYV